MNEAREAAWKEVHDSLNREGKWNVGEYGNFYGFFLSGWTMGFSAGLEAAAKVAERYTIGRKPKLITLIAQHNTAASIAEEIRSLSPDVATTPSEQSLLAKVKELLEADPIALRKFWNEHWPEKELEAIANNLGHSFD